SVPCSSMCTRSAISSLQPPRPASSTLFPYTTLFRSARHRNFILCRRLTPEAARALEPARHVVLRRRFPERPTRGERTPIAEIMRSEEHTSELQSRGHLVCRLLLEKKIR